MQDASMIFREEALRHHRQGDSSTGDVLRLAPGWIDQTYRLILVVSLLAAFFCVFGRLNEYAAGTAIIRDEAQTSITAIVGGNVHAVLVHAGQKVTAGQALLQFHGPAERAELESLTRQAETQQIAVLRNPQDLAAQQQLALARSQKEAAEKRLRERTVFAPRDGVIGDIRIRPGQQVNPGELLMRLEGEQGSLYVISILPGHYRPLLKTDQALRLEVNGFRYAYQKLNVDAVGEEVIGPNEARRYLGQEIADSLALQGPVVLVRSRLASRKFQANNQTFEWRDGMQARAEVRVRSQRILLALIPGLKSIFGGSHE